jgi:hypothetical protein
MFSVSQSSATSSARWLPHISTGSRKSFHPCFFSQKKCRQPTACQTTCVPSLAPIQVAKELLKGDPLTLGNFDQVWGALVRRGCGGLWLAKMGYMAMARKGGSI